MVKRLVKILDYCVRVQVPPVASREGVFFRVSGFPSAGGGFHIRSYFLYPILPRRRKVNSIPKPIIDVTVLTVWSFDTTSLFRNRLRVAKLDSCNQRNQRQFSLVLNT